MLYNKYNTGELDIIKKNFVPVFLPNLYIIGAQKSGTTTLANMLHKNRNVLISTPKEPRYFEYEYPLGLKFYLEKYYQNYQNEKIIGEARTTHMMIPYVSDRIRETNPDSKIIAILRNPIERAFSAWSHFSSMRPGREILDVATALRRGMENYNPRLWESEQDYVLNLDPMGGPYHGAYIEGGCYANLLKNWIGKFKNIKILFSQDLLSDSSSVYNSVCNFLEIEPETFNFENKNIGNQYSAEQIKSLNRDLYFELASFYRSDIEKLSNIVNRDLIMEWLNEKL